MRYARDRKQQTRTTILLNACRRFAAQGFEATSIDEIMRDCKLTRGGFYAHFKSKSELYRNAIALANESRKTLRRDADNWIEVLFDELLHAEGTAFFATDAASREPEVRQAYSHAFESLRADIANRVAARIVCDPGTTVALTALLIGAIAVTRSIDGDELKQRLVAACKDNAKSLLERGDDALSFFWEPPTPSERARYRVRTSE